jgi:hypothetical protein
VSAAPAMHVGLDLENTLIDYARVFGPVGVDLGLLPADMADANKAHQGLMSHWREVMVPKKNRSGVVITQRRKSKMLFEVRFEDTLTTHT